MPILTKIGWWLVTFGGGTISIKALSDLIHYFGK